MTCLIKDQQISSSRKTGPIGQVTIGSKKNPVCILGNPVITVPGHINKIPSKITCLIEWAKHHNLPLGIVINRCVATTRAKGVPVILINTIKHNTRIQQPFLATELFTLECHQIKHMANMEKREGNTDI